MYLIMYEEVGEAVETVVIFRDGHALPRSFRWRGREYKIDRVCLEHREIRGESVLFCFSVICAGGSYELLFDSHSLAWRMERIWTE